MENQTTYFIKILDIVSMRKRKIIHNLFIIQNGKLKLNKISPKEETWCHDQVEFLAFGILSSEMVNLMMQISACALSIIVIIKH